jgi:VanZ family protein
MTPPPSAKLRRVRHILLAMLAAVWIAAFAATHAPPPAVPRIDVSDTVKHAVTYFALGGTFLAALIAYRVPRGRRDVIVVAILSSYAILDELTQPLVKRSAELSDGLADLAGVLGALIVVETLCALLARRGARRE